MDAGGINIAGGTPLNHPNPGSLPSGIAFVNPGQGLALFSGYANAAYSQMLFGFDGSGSALITVNSVGGGSAGASFLSPPWFSCRRRRQPRL
jgi:hypothetical protein